MPSNEADKSHGGVGQFAAIHGIRYAMGDAAAPMPAAFAAEPSLERRQVHGTRIVEVTQPGQSCGEADGFYTRTPGVMVNVLTADCLPVLFAHQNGHTVAAVHAGWRGLLAGVLEQAADTFIAAGEEDQWCCLIGPAIGACCYEVDADLVSRFITTLPSIAPELISPAPRQLDLQAIAKARLEHRGINSIDTIRECTLCTTQCGGGDRLYRYASYRRDGPGVPNQYACILIEPTG